MRETPWEPTHGGTPATSWIRGVTSLLSGESEGRLTERLAQAQPISEDISTTKLPRAAEVATSRMLSSLRTPAHHKGSQSGGTASALPGAGTASALPGAGTASAHRELAPIAHRGSHCEHTSLYYSLYSHLATAE